MFELYKPYLDVGKLITILIFKRLLLENILQEKLFLKH